VTVANLKLGPTGHVTIPVNGLGSSNSIYVTGGGGGGSGAYVMNNSGWTTAASDIKSGSIHVQGDAVFHGNITWQNRDMREWFEAVESRLGMLQPNPKMETDWDELRELGDRYRALEKKLTEQQRVFDILKKNST
jgi:hypothetical protein